MQQRHGKILYSAGDLVSFLKCEHATTLALTDLGTPLSRAPAVDKQHSRLSIRLDPKVENKSA